MSIKIQKDLSSRLVVHLALVDLVETCGCNSSVTWEHKFKKQFKESNTIVKSIKCAMRFGQSFAHASEKSFSQNNFLHRKTIWKPHIRGGMEFVESALF